MFVVYEVPFCPQMNSITTIPAGSLPSNLKEISLMDNPITTIDDSAFDESADTLESLTFTSALFTRIPDAFLRLNALKSLTIYTTRIEDWNSNAMIHIGQTLGSFFVENCDVDVWPAWIQNFTHLTELSMSSGSISSIPDGTFDKVTDKLTSLALFNNSLTSVPKALSKLSTLRELNLQENKISDLSWLPKYSNLTTLSLNNNSISDAHQLSIVLLPYAASLYEFDIQNNKLTAIPDISYLDNIVSLDFTNNWISDPSSGSLPPALFSLHLDYNFLPLIPRIMMHVEIIKDMVLFSNNIKEIRKEDFPQWALGAELSYNLITELTDDSFPAECMVEFLHLNHNPVSRISSHAFRNTPQLNEIMLQNTRLTRVPLSLTSAARLSYVDFTGSVNLVCTCVEKSFGQWITSVPGKTILGDCGETNVYNFFTALSPDCPDK